MRLCCIIFVFVFFVFTFPSWFLIWAIMGFPSGYWNWIFTLGFTERTIKPISNKFLRW